MVITQSDLFKKHMFFNAVISRAARAGVRPGRQAAAGITCGDAARSDAVGDGATRDNYWRHPRSARVKLMNMMRLCIPESF